MKALTFKKTAAQGEIMLRYLGPLSAAKKLVPAGKPLPLENGMFIIGHSETGHHHVLERTKGVEVIKADNAPAGMECLYLLLDDANKVVHKRDHDTHAPIALNGGSVYEARLAREHDHYAELARKSMD